MERKNASRSGMLLLELMMAILIFSLSAAVCIQVFVKAHDLSARAEDLSQAVNSCGSAAEILRTADSPREGLDLLEQMCTQTQREDDLFRGRLEDASLEISWQEDQGLITYTITCLDENQSPVYSLELVCLEGGGV